MTRIVLAALAAVAAGAGACAAAPSAQDAAAAHELFDAYAADAAHPYGRLNPDAPEAVAAYAFMVGDWDCADVINRQGEEPVTAASRVRGEHYLNGYGYINRTYNQNGVGVMTYVYDADDAGWVVDYTAAPNFAASRWTTVDVGEDGALATETPGRQEGVMVRSVFHDIADDAFAWRLDIATPQGVFTARTSACARVA